MKKSLLLFAIIFCAATKSMATQYMVMVSNFTFTPSSFNMHLGDTVLFMWSNGTHTTTSTTIPAGATAWNSNIDASTTTFMYKPTKQGVYNYQCNFHVSSGMIGSFTVLSPTDVPSIAPSPTVSIFPNPVAGLLHVQFTQTDMPASVILADVTGRTIVSNTYNGVKETELNLKDIPNGFYVISISQNNTAIKQELIISH